MKDGTRAESMTESMKENIYPNDWYVHGPNRADFSDHLWMFPTEEAAKHFAENIAKDTGAVYVVLRKAGRVRPIIPVEWDK